MVFTPNEIMNKQFNKTMGFGYKIDDVEHYLSDVASYVAQLQDEKKDLEKKLEILADKLEEYRQDEDSLRTALLGAQKLGDGVIRESKTKAEIIMRDATIKAEKMIDTAQQKIEQEQIALARMQKEVANFKSRLLALYKQHLELISALPGDEEEVPGTSEASQQKAAAAPQPVETESSAPVHEPQYDEEQEAVDTVPEQVDTQDEDDLGSQAFSLGFGRKSAHPVEEPENEEEDDEEQETVPSRGESRFGPLKFGEGFGLTHKEDEAPKRRPFRLDRNR